MDIEKAYNIGPVIGAALRSVGISTLEELEAQGWEESYIKLVESYPEYIHTMCAVALIGAVENMHWRKVSKPQKSYAKKLTDQLKKQIS